MESGPEDHLLAPGKLFQLPGPKFLFVFGFGIGGKGSGLKLTECGFTQIADPEADFLLVVIPQQGLNTVPADNRAEMDFHG